MLKKTINDLFSLYDSLRNLNDYYIGAKPLLGGVNSDNVPGFITSTINRVRCYIPDTQLLNAVRVTPTDADDAIYITVTDNKFTRVEKTIGKFNETGFTPVYVIVLPNNTFEIETELIHVVENLTEIFVDLIRFDSELTYDVDINMLNPLDRINVPFYDTTVIIAAISVVYVLIKQWFNNVSKEFVLQEVIDSFSVACREGSENTDTSFEDSENFEAFKKVILGIESIDDVKNAIASNEFLVPLISTIAPDNTQ